MVFVRKCFCWQILSTKNPFLIPNWDYSHQINLLIGLLMKSKTYSTVRLIQNVNFIKSSQCRMECFQIIQDCSGEERQSLKNFAQTRWTSDCSLITTFVGYVLQFSFLVNIFDVLGKFLTFWLHIRVTILKILNLFRNKNRFYAVLIFFWMLR